MYSGWNVVTAPNTLSARRPIDSKKPPSYTHCHRIGPLPGGALFPEGGGPFHWHTQSMHQPITSPTCIGDVSAKDFADLRDDHVVVRRVHPADYPNYPYHPPEAYPEYRQLGSRTSEHNQVYGGVRSILVDLGLDSDNVGTKAWNPLGRFVSPGKRAVIKPNWVLHANQDDGSIESLITHTSVIRAVIDYLIIALRGEGEIEVVDAPLQNCDFDELVRRNMITDLITDYTQRFTGVTFSVLDLRRTTLQTRELQVPGVARQTNRAGDPRGYSMIDLSQESLLVDIHHRFRRFRVANYDHRLMHDHHNRNKHEYLVANSILTADFLVNVPKLKFHIKAGVTAALKNLVGINGHKEFLPHHTNGSPERGGDQYSRRGRLKPLINHVYDDYWMYVNERTQFRNLMGAIFVRTLRKVAAVVDGDRMYDGAWSGNITIPRTTLDLNHALYFYDCNANKLSDTQLRRVLHIVDGVVAGEGYGPLRPSPKRAGVLLGGWNPLTIDVCAATLIGLDPMKVALLRYGVTDERSRLNPFHLTADGIRVTDEGRRRMMTDIHGLGFRIPRAWKAAIQAR